MYFFARLKVAFISITSKKTMIFLLSQTYYSRYITF